MQNLKYVIKSVPSDNPQALENLLNEMSQEGWDLYSMHEVESDEGFQYNCIFASDNSNEKTAEEEDIVNIKTFKSQMEKMLSSTFSPYESCKEIQEKIKEQRKKIAKIKTQLEAQSEVPVSKNRQKLNNEISQGLKELDELRQNLIKTISPEAMYSKVHQEKLSINLSEEALDLVNPDMGGVLISETVKIREKLTEELGYVLPKVIFEDDDKLNAYEFSIKIRGLEAVNSFVYPNFLMFFEDELKLDKKQKDIIHSTDEITGRKIVWIEEKKTKDFWQKGLKPEEFIARLLEWIVIRNIDELFDYSDLNQYLEIVGKKNLFLVENIMPDFISVAELKYVLTSLLREEVSIKDIIYIFEKINDFSDEDSKEDLLDKIRISLSKHISKKIANSDGVIQAFELGEDTYKKLFSKLSTKDKIVRIDGKKVEKIITSVIKKAKEYNLDLNSFVILAPFEIRHMLFMMLSQFIPNIKVIAKEEIANEYVVEILDEV
ncbi:MAG: FHIPEP family type III secretion protein [Candidatus Gastranaerophilales bacterium]|nr:FHIPEP family type III secretion protein [Candidatus Gastranaerophilales bacterium]